MTEDKFFVRDIGWHVTEDDCIVTTWGNDVPDEYTRYGVVITPDFYYEENEFRYLVALYRLILWDMSGANMSERIKVEVVKDHAGIIETVKEYLQYIHEECSVTLEGYAETTKEAKSVAGRMEFLTNTELKEGDFPDVG